MVFPFKQLRRWASPSKGERNRLSKANPKTSQAPSSTVSPVPLPMNPTPSAPRPNGEDETRAYIDGDPHALARLRHAQVLAADRARNIMTRVRGPRYSPRAKGRDATLALITQPDDPGALGQLLAQMAETERTSGLPKLPPFRKYAGGFVSLRELVGKEVDLVLSPLPSGRVSVALSAIFDDIEQRAVDDFDRLQLNISCDDIGLQVVPADASQGAEVEEVMREYERPLSRWSNYPSCSDSDSDEEDDDDGGSGSEPLSPRNADGNQRGRAGHPGHIPDLGLPIVYARVHPIPNQIPPVPPRSLARRSLRTVGPRIATGPARPVIIHHQPRKPSHSPLSVTPVHHYTSAEGQTRLSHIRRYLSLPAELPPCELLLYLLKLDRSVRLDAALANPALADQADDVGWEGVEAEVAELRRRGHGNDDDPDGAMERAWNTKMVATFLEAEVSLFTWDADEAYPAVAEGDDDDDDLDEDLSREIADTLRRRGAVMRDEEDEVGDGEDMRQKFRVQFRKRAKSMDRKPGESGVPRRRIWEKPGKSPLSQVQVSEDLDEVESGHH